MRWPNPWPVARWLRARPLAEAARLALTRDASTLVLVLDQFEEYLQRYAGDLGNLPAALGALLRSPSICAWCCPSEEFLASVDACLRGHVLALFASTYHLEHLDRERAREAIAAPAKRFGGNVKKPGGPPAGRSGAR
jgi:hypothetical protein